MPGRGRPFLPGNNANPRGRPRAGETLAEYVRGLGGPDGRVYVDRLHALALGDNPKLAMQAIGILLERGYGKPPQELAVSGALTPLDPAALARLSDAELEMAAALGAKLTGRPATKVPTDTLTDTLAGGHWRMEADEVDTLVPVV